MKISAKVVSEPDFPKMERKISGTFSNNFIKLTKLGAKYLQGIMPRKTGAMKASVRYNNNEIWSTSKYYHFVDKGTRPHRIEGLLRFKINGATIFSRGVDHPGTKAQNLSERTMKEIDKNIPIIVKEINAAIS